MAKHLPSVPGQQIRGFGLTAIALDVAFVWLLRG